MPRCPGAQSYERPDTGRSRTNNTIYTWNSQVNFQETLFYPSKQCFYLYQLEMEECYFCTRMMSMKNICFCICTCKMKILKEKNGKTYWKKRENGLYTTYAIDTSGSSVMMKVMVVEYLHISPSTTRTSSSSMV